ncbi:MAG: MFS transporter, partial [Bryobacteraceae bacterium]
MKFRHRVLALLFFLSIITYLDRVCISVAGPRIQNDLHLSPQMWGWVLGAFTLAYSLMEIPSGSMGDRFGPRRALTRIVLWWSAFTTLTGAASGFWSLIVTRFCFGAGEAGAYPNSSASIGRWFPASERGSAQGIVWMASRLGGALAPLLVVPIQIHYGWRASFWCFGGLGAIWAVIWYGWFRDHPSEKPGVSAAELAEIGRTPTNTRHSLPWRIAIRSRNFWIILLMYHTYCWGSHFYISWLHTYLEKGRGFTESQMEIFSTFPFLMG